MKRKFYYLALFVLVVLCIFALSASAQEYTVVDDLGNPSWYTGNYELMTDKTSQVVLSNGDGTYTAFPAYYILKYNIKVTDGVVTEASISSVDYSFLTDNGYSYTKGAIYKIELPNGLTSISSEIFGLHITEPNVTEIIMPDSMRTIGSHAFRAAPSLKKIVFSKNLTKISSYAFYEAKALEEFVLPGGSEEYLDISEENIFYNCIALREADISTRKIKKIGSSCFSKCTALGRVALPDTVEEIGGYFLFECYNAYLASDFLPTSLKKIGFQFLAGCTAVTNRVIYFPEGFTGASDAFTATYVLATERYKTTNTTLVFLGKMTGTIALEQFHVNSGQSLTLVFTKNDYADLAGNIVHASTDGTKAYIANTADTADTDYFVKEGTLTLKLGNAGESHSKYKTDENGNTLYYVANSSYQIYFCGGDDVEVCYGIRGNKVNSEWGKQFTTPFTFDKAAHTAANVHYDLNAVLSLPNCGVDGVAQSTCVICDRVAETRTPATGNHTLVYASSCTDKCTVCLNYIQSENPAHNCNESIAYANGFAAAGEHNAICTNEGCTHSVTSATSAIFEVIGFSTPMSNDRAGLALGFYVDNNAISDYTRISGKTFKFGVFAVAYDKIGTNDILDENETPANGVLSTDVTAEVKVVEIRILGFVTEKHKNAKLSLGVYTVTSDENGKEISYIQSSEPQDEGGKYSYKTYNEALEQVSKA